MCTMITPLVRHSAGISASAAMSAAVVRIGFAGRKGLVGVHTPMHRFAVGFSILVTGGAPGTSGEASF